MAEIKLATLRVTNLRLSSWSNELPPEKLDVNATLVRVKDEDCLGELSLNGEKYGSGRLAVLNVKDKLTFAGDYELILRPVGEEPSVEIGSRKFREE